jgi:hypothetical protein
MTAVATIAARCDAQDGSEWESMAVPELSAFVERNAWSFARTMPKHPHEYVLLWKCSSERDFFRFAMTIRRYGYDENFFTKRIRYMDLCGRRYWTMGDLLETTWVLNRATNKGPDVPMAPNPTPFQTNPPVSLNTVVQVANSSPVR